MYLYIKALHIIFVVTWFAGLFYTPRLLVYNTEAGDKPDEVRTAMRLQFIVMIRRLWFGITWPSAVLTLLLGGTTWYLMGISPAWLKVKLIFVALLYVYHLSLHLIVKQQTKGIFKYSSQHLRVWNEIATILLVAIVMLAVVKETISFIWGLVGLVLFIIILMSAIKIYKMIRTKSK